MSISAVIEQQKAITKKNVRIMKAIVLSFIIGLGIASIIF